MDDARQLRKRVLVDWIARYGHVTLPGWEGDPELRATLLNFALEVLELRKEGDLDGIHELIDSCGGWIEASKSRLASGD